MKRWTLALLLTCFTATAFSQQLPPPPKLTYHDYLQKSKKQKTAAWVLTSAGTVGLMATLGADLGQALGGGLTTVISLGTVEPEYKSYTVPYLLSAACLVGGIGFFVAASKNKQRARSLYPSAVFKMEKAPVLQANGIKNQHYPSIAVNISL